MSGSPFDRRETATIVAGLRLLQLGIEEGVTGSSLHGAVHKVHNISTNVGEFNPLDAEEIDDLCELVNTL